MEVEKALQTSLSRSQLEMRITEMRKDFSLKCNDLYDLLEATADIQPQWFDLGLALGIPQYELEKLQEKFSVTRCLYEMLSFWIRRIGASWKSLIDALESSSVEQRELANEIRKKHANEKGIKIQYIKVKENEKQLSKDDDLSEVFAKVDWRVLGLLLGVNDEDLENIQQSHLTENQCQKAMFECWISTDWAYWSILVEALRGPVLGEDELAEDLESKHLGINTSSRSKNGQDEIAGDLEIDMKQVKNEQERIDHALHKTVGRSGKQPKGIIFICCVTGPAGIDVDFQRVHETFANVFNFAIHRNYCPNDSQLAQIIYAAATYKYPRTCRLKGFYFAGHGGIDESSRPFFNTVMEKAVSVQQHILGPIQKKMKRTDSFMFFFDCCLTSKSGYELEKKPFALDIPPCCLVAFATSPGEGSSGDEKKGGKWTDALCNHLEKFREGDTLTHVLENVNEEMMSSVDFPDSNQPIQCPQLRSMTGPIYLKGNPKNKDIKGPFGEIRQKLESLLASSEKILTSLSGVLKDASVIEENFEQEVNENRGEEAAKLLLDDLEKTMRNVPEAESVILKKMQEIQPLHPLIKQIKKGHEDLEQKDEDPFGKFRPVLESLLASNEKTLITLSAILEDESMIDEEVGEKVYHQSGKDGAKLLLEKMAKTIRKDPQAKSDILEKMEEQKVLCELIKRIKENQRMVLQDCKEKLSSIEEKLQV